MKGIKMKKDRSALRIVSALFFSLFLASGFDTKAQTQAPPSTDIYVVNVTTTKGVMKFGTPVNVTNRPGYDNQPYFLPDSKSFFFTAIGDDKQAEIYRYVVATKSLERLTNTAEAEYSPTLTPDGKAISVIKVEKDNTQRLWKFPFARNAGVSPALASSFTLVLENIKPVGYHVWIDANTLGLFVLGNPSTLQMADIRTGKAEVIAQNIGRSLHRIPKQNKISFIHRVSDTELWVKSFDPKTREIAPLVKTLPGVEYCAWTPDGKLLMAKDAKLFMWDSKKGGDWTEVADFSASGTKGITRIAVSPDGKTVVFVAEGKQ
jgi:WD40 repeat protein